MNEETLLMGRMLSDLTHRAEGGSVTIRREEDRWLVRARFRTAWYSGTGATLLLALSRALHRILAIESAIEFVEDPIITTEGVTP